ncbi:conserved hypothetical protein [Trichinella spiralis]|uniref:hypothetical protein n=1 Tax=Trichinella spiralis TaxID=6334 RepID=UPI0001EFE45A|nr:conserved hypothetical protein [Trichinella spiralis]
MHIHTQIKSFYGSGIPRKTTPNDDTRYKMIYYFPFCPEGKNVASFSRISREDEYNKDQLHTTQSSPTGTLLRLLLPLDDLVWEISRREAEYISDYWRQSKHLTKSSNR